MFEVWGSMTFNEVHDVSCEVHEVSTFRVISILPNGINLIQLCCFYCFSCGFPGHFWNGFPCFAMCCKRKQSLPGPIAAHTEVALHNYFRFRGCIGIAWPKRPWCPKGQRSKFVVGLLYCHVLSCIVHRRFLADLSTLCFYLWHPTYFCEGNPPSSNSEVLSTFGDAMSPGVGADALGETMRNWTYWHIYTSYWHSCNTYL